MTQNRLLTTKELAVRWGISRRTLDRLRKLGVLAWIDVASGSGMKPVIRFTEGDIELYESTNRMFPKGAKEVKNGAS